MVTYSVPNPPVRAAGTWLTSAIYGSDVTESVQFLANVPVFIGVQSSVQSTSTGGWTTLTFDTHTDDTYGGHSTSVNNSRYTAQRAGYYRVSGTASFATNSTGSRGCRISKNGSVVTGSGQLVGAGTLNAVVACNSMPVQLAVGDYVELSAGQNSGGSLSTNNSSESACTFVVEWMHA
ncbi:MAG: hypothetical protein HOZ81_20555 [Streptomyces sp.]|nr:hypothetical protein [Streptomyces sp.]NUS24416.1 hypothetical protein [Streptomyces sp.]